MTVSAPAAAAIAEVNEIMAADGAELIIAGASFSSIRLELDLSRSSCPECVVPRSLALDILTAKLALTDPDISHIELYDPREDPGYPAAAH